MGLYFFPFNQRSSLRKEMKDQDSQTIQAKILDKLPEGFLFLYENATQARAPSWPRGLRFPPWHSFT